MKKTLTPVTKRTTHRDNEFPDTKNHRFKEYVTFSHKKPQYQATLLSQIEFFLVFFQAIPFGRETQRKQRKLIAFVDFDNENKD